MSLYAIQLSILNLVFNKQFILSYDLFSPIKEKKMIVFVRTNTSAFRSCEEMRE